MSASNKSLLRAFRLFYDFESASPEQKKKRIDQVERLLSEAENRKTDANLALRTIDQLKKERAYMLISAGRLNEGIGEIERIVREYEKSIASLHDEAVFILAEAALSCFRKAQTTRGLQLTRCALAHAGSATWISKTLVSALEIAQQVQLKRSKRRLAGQKKR
jgi:hypothetical protein